MSSSITIPAGGVSFGGGVGFAEGISARPIPQARGSLADDIDPITGELRTLLGRVHLVDAAIQWQFSHVRGSGGAVQASGHRYRDIRKKTDNVNRRLADEARRIVEPFVDRRLVRFGQLVTETADDRQGVDGAAQLVTYTNRLTGNDETITTP